MSRLDPSVKASLSLFLPTWLPELADEKKARKAHTAGHDAYTLHRVYDLQLQAQSFIKSIEMSQLLACNDVVLPIIVKEYVDLYKALDVLKKALVKVKQVLPTAMIDSKLKLKDCADALYFDLHYFNDTWGILNGPIDITHWMGVYKAAIADYITPTKNI